MFWNCIYYFNQFNLQSQFLYQYQDDDVRDNEEIMMKLKLIKSSLRERMDDIDEINEEHELE